MNDVAKMISSVHRAVSAGSPPEKAAEGIVSGLSEKVRNNARLSLIVDTLIDVSETDDERTVYQEIRKLI